MTTIQFRTKSDNRTYEIDGFGAIHQIDARPFKYDEKYVSTYDTPEYKNNALQLQAMRYGFVCASFGRPVKSLLDFGCGNGEFLRYAYKGIPYVGGFDVTGKDNIDEKIRIFDHLVSTDVYTFWDALEHVPDLNILKDLPCDMIAVSLPCCNVKDTEEFDSWFHRKPDEHLHHFNATSLRTTMKNYGWTDIAESYHEDIIRKRNVPGGKNILSMSFIRE